MQLPLGTLQQMLKRVESVSGRRGDMWPGFTASTRGPFGAGTPRALHWLTGLWVLAVVAGTVGQGGPVGRAGAGLLWEAGCCNRSQPHGWCLGR